MQSLMRASNKYELSKQGLYRDEIIALKPYITPYWLIFDQLYCTSRIGSYHKLMLFHNSNYFIDWNLSMNILVQQHVSDTDERCF